MINIEEVKNEMSHWFMFELTDEQIKTYLNDNSLEYFDTVERDDYADYLAKEITGMDFPMNEDDKEKFYTLLAQNSSKMGYKWNVKKK